MLKWFRIYHKSANIFEGNAVTFFDLNILRIKPSHLIKYIYSW